ncbi:glycerol-3-phosphate 1-O-acyltransferase PlsY [Thermodesulfobacteriota bacterium]
MIENGSRQFIDPLWIFLPFASYLLGSIPFGSIISHRVASIDITRRGSGNIGATNVARELGIKWGILTLLLDVLKGFIPVFLARLLLPDAELGISFVGLAALLGHQFSIFTKLKGGKGIATALGVYLATSPEVCLIALALFILTVLLTDFVSLGSILAAASMPLFLILFAKPDHAVMTAFIITVLIWFKHRENIERMLRGEERHWRKKGLTTKDQESD